MEEWMEERTWFNGKGQRGEAEGVKKGRQGKGEKEQWSSLDGHLEREYDEARTNDERSTGEGKGRTYLPGGAYHCELRGWHHAYTSRMQIMAPINVATLGLCDWMITRTLANVLQLDSTIMKASC
jgi:hypothetical protein